MTEEAIDHPKHYNNRPSGVEAIDIVEHMSFNVSNAVKYLWRAGLKPGAGATQDLGKARWYVARELDRCTKDLDSVANPLSSEVRSMLHDFCEAEPDPRIAKAVMLMADIDAGLLNYNKLEDVRVLINQLDGELTVETSK